MERTQSSISLAGDDRGRVPFAVIGVLLLVGSVALVGYHGARQTPDVDTDSALAMDRTVAASQTALRDAAAHATAAAAREPVTRLENDDIGRAIAGGDPADLSRDEIFVRYVKLRIYLEVQDRLERVDQPVGDDVTGTVALEPVTDADDVEAAIDSVELRVGGDDLDYGDPGGADLGAGKLAVTVDGVEFAVERDGRTVAERTTAMNATIDSPLFEAHDRTREYERQLNTDFRESDAYEGFTDYFAARLYPLVWARGAAQSDGAPVSDVLSNAHLEVLANDAVFATQRQVFGATDPRSDETLTGAYACLLSTDARQVYETPDGNGDSLAETTAVLDDEFCDDLTHIHGEGDGDRSDPPDWRALASENAYLAETERIDLDDTATAVLGELVQDDASGIERAIERTYAVNASAESTVETTVFPPQYEDGTNEALLGYEVDVEQERVLDADETGVARDFYEFTVVFEGAFERDADGEEPTDAVVRYDVSLTVGGEHGPESAVEERGIDYDYKVGTPDGTELVSDRNFVDVPETAVEELLAGVDDASEAEEQLEAYFARHEDAIVEENAITDGDDVVDTILAGERTVTVEPTPHDVEALKGWVVSELDQLESDVSAVRIDPERRELLAGESPIAELEAAIGDDEEWVYGYAAGDDTYATVPDKVRAAVYREYMERLRDRVANATDRHEATTETVDTELTNHMGRGLATATDFAATQFDGDPVEPPATTPEHELSGEVRITPVGSPTYLTLEPVDSRQVPATDGEYGFAPMAAKSDGVYAIPFENASNGVELRTAGAVLQAGYLTGELRPADEWDERRTEALEAALENWIDGYAEDAGEYAAEPFAGLTEAEITAAIADEIAAIGSTDRQAIRLGEGEETLDDIARNVSRTVERPADSDYDYYGPTFEAHLEGAVRYGLDAALGADGRIEDGEIPRRTLELGLAVRDELNATERNVSAERRAQVAGDSFANTTRTATGEAWMYSAPEVDAFAPNRVPSGAPMTDLPMWDVLTVNAWHVTLSGEYARFIVRADYGRPADQPFRYVKEAGTVTLELGGDEVVVGETEPVRFDSRLSVPVAVPSDTLGVGDRSGGSTECSDTFDEVGPLNAAGEPDRCRAP